MPVFTSTSDDIAKRLVMSFEKQFRDSLHKEFMKVADKVALDVALELANNLRSSVAQCNRVSEMDIQMVLKIDGVQINLDEMRKDRK